MSKLKGAEWGTLQSAKARRSLKCCKKFPIVTAKYPGVTISQNWGWEIVFLESVLPDVAILNSQLG